MHELLVSRLRAKVLSWFFLHEDERCFVRQLCALLNEDVSNLSRELARLEHMGILSSTLEGRQKYYRVNPECPLHDELRGIAVKTSGPAPVLRAELAALQKQISAAFIYGSHAAGSATGSSDIDLFVIGDVDEMALHRAVTRAEDRLGRTINYGLMGNAEFGKRRKEKTGFLSRVLGGPKIFILGEEREV